MAEYQQRLDGIFQALADPTRRGVLARLGCGPASVGELARPVDMALPSFMKHVQLLERVGLIRTYKQGRVRTCAIEEATLAAVDDWLSHQRAVWEGRTHRLERFVTQTRKKARSE